MKSKLIVVSFIWLVILFVFAAAWKLWWVPSQEEAVEQAAQEAHEEAIRQTGSASKYRTQINFAYDSFSGYSIFRSENFKNNLSQKSLKVNLVDDGANYIERLKGLQSGKYQMAAFTIDALIKASDEIGDLPATIVEIIDESRGCDAMTGYKLAIPDLDALNDPEVKFILIENFPAETLSRVVMSHFGLNNVSEKSFIPVANAEEVYRRYRESKPSDKFVFVLWEPYVTKMLENPNVHDLVNSSRFRGYIVDVIVASRDFLVKDEQAVRDFIEAYLSSVYHYRNTMESLVASDAKEAGTPLNDEQIKRLVKGIWWKNTVENYAHMGVESHSLQHIEDMIANITKVLISTGSISSDPANGQPNILYYNKILSDIKNNNFFPGKENLRTESDVLPSLNDEEWSKLTPVGTLKVPKIVFARGTSKVTSQSEITLNELVEKLKTWPQYYLVIKGDASLRGDIEANKALALERAKSVERYLLNHGISSTRVKAVAVEPTGSTDVMFQLGYLPY